MDNNENKNEVPTEERAFIKQAYEAARKRGLPGRDIRVLSVESRRDPNKRLKSFGIPEETCVRYERLVGVKTGERPDYIQRLQITNAMISAMEEGVRHVQLTSEDYEQIAANVRANEAHRRQCQERIQSIVESKKDK